MEQNKSDRTISKFKKLSKSKNSDGIIARLFKNSNIGNQMSVEFLWNFFPQKQKNSKGVGQEFLILIEFLLEYLNEFRPWRIPIWGTKWQQ